MDRKKSMDELMRKSVGEFKQAAKIPLVVVLDNIRSKHNIGAIFRTSDAFLVDKIYLCGITDTPPDKEIEKTALGATESVEWEKTGETLVTIKQLKAEGYIIVSVEQTQNSITPQQFNFTENKNKIALVLGHEVFGVSEDVIAESDYCLELPQYGTKHSLNVSVCGGIVIWEFFKKLHR